MKKPRVVLFGNISQKPYINNLLPVVRAFEKISELTVVEPYLTPGFVSTPSNPTPVPLELVDKYAGLRPDYLLCLGGGLRFSPEGRAQFGSDVVTAGVALSDPLSVDGSIEMARYFDLYYTHDPNSIAAYRANGIDVKFCAAATDPELYQPTGEPRTIDLLFYGKWTPRRDALLSRLARRMTVQVHTYSHQKQWSIEPRPPLDDPQSLAETISRAKMVLEFAIVEDCGEYTGKYRITNRPQIAACCETVSLIEDFPEVKDHFVPGEEIETFRDEEELEAKVDALLANESRRLEMGRRARQRILRDQTWDQRAAQLLEDATRLRRQRKGGFFSRIFGR